MNKTEELIKLDEQEALADGSRVHLLASVVLASSEHPFRKEVFVAIFFVTDDCESHN